MNLRNAVSARAPRSSRSRFLRLLVAGAAICIPGALPAAETSHPVSYYVDAALANNPSLASMKQRIAAKGNEAVRTGALPDPKAWIGVSNIPTNTWSFSEEDMTGKEFGISQMLPYPGQRENAAKIVEREKEQVEFELAEMP